MPAPLSQDDQSGSLTTPFGDDVLALSHITAVEGLSELFEFHIEAVSLEANLNFNKALGLGCTVKLTTVDNHDRYFHGVMTEAHWAGGQQDLYRYQLVLRPWLWLLTRTSNCRIFKQLTPIQIIKQVFSDRGFSDFRDATKGSPPKLEYCVQYRETDFNFVSRLMEEYGAYYFFEHSEDKHTLVLADAKSSHTPVPDLASLPFIPAVEGGRREQQYVETWSRGRAAQTGVYVLEDYGYKKPSGNLLAQSQKAGGYAHDSMEMFDYPYGYVDTEGNDLIKQDIGENFAKYRVEAVQSHDNRRASTGRAPSLFPGGLITLTGFVGPIGGENQEYLVAHCTQNFGGLFYRSGAAVGHFSYTAAYEMTPSDRQFRAPLITPKPNIAGYQSALVIRDKSNPGEEIDVDELGRILVFFYWDREKKYARRIRVAQIWAGSNRGALFTPRVGDEVLIAYEEGDPDRPIVIGSVYNGNNTVPMTLPDKKVKSGIVTMSSKGGNGYHMFLFDDTAGSEIVKLRSQKDLMFKALNNEQRDIVSSQTENVGQDETINVGFPVPPQGTAPGSGNFTLNALSTVTINVGPQGSPMTQIVMDTSSITLNVGPQGMASQIVMNMEGITLNVGPGGLAAQIQMDATGVTVSGTPASQLMVQPMGITTLTPMMTFSYGPVTFASPMVTIPLVTIGAGTASGMPII
jgi:type VI secretion system secreted protein VgrG